MAVEKITDNIVDCEISDVMHQSMMPYSEYVILDRALPRVEDGLKPVQRRILYSMYDLGITPDKSYRKSARVVGDCLGKYHPHGDSSVYGAMVRMAQSFNMGEMLVDGQGNFGSIDGDSPAAMRYTEVKLKPLAMEMLKDIDKNTVKWSLNFDDTTKEPNTLPARYPNLLVNGASGIAVGLATNIPPHNLTEVIDGVCAYIDNPKISLEDMMQYIEGPDFPTGGKLITDEGLYKAYETGRGKVVLKATTNIEKDGDKFSIIITELPYQVNKANLLAKIDELRETKKENFGNIADIIDESDRNGMRAVIKIKREGNVNKILSNLFKYTDMQQNFNFNMVAIADGRPQQLGLIEIIKYYVEYQREVVFKRSQYDLQNAKTREHILQGIIIAIENIDEVIAIIKSSPNVSECKIRLRERFDISEKQAQAILDIKLSRLTKLEVNNLKEEIAELLKIIDRLSAVIKSTAKQFAIVKNEMLALRKEYKRNRRTKIEVEGAKDNVTIIDVNLVLEKSGVAVLTNGETVKFLSKKAYNSANKSIENMTPKDMPITVCECDNKSPLYAFTERGNIHTFSVDNLSLDKWRHKGTYLSKLIPSLNEEKVITIMTESVLTNNTILFMTKNGMLKLCDGKECLITKKSISVGIKDDDKIVSIEIKDDAKNIVAITKDSMALVMQSDIPVQGRKAMGVIGIALNDGDEVISATQIDDEGEIIAISNNGYGKRLIAGLLKVSVRNRKGNKIFNLIGKNGTHLIYSGYVKEPFDLMLVGENDEVVTVNSEDINIETISARGRLLANIVGEVVSAIKNNIPNIFAKNQQSTDINEDSVDDEFDE